VRRSRWIAVAVLLLAVVQVLVTTTVAQGTSDGLTHLRITLTTSSDWASVGLQGAEVRVQGASNVTAGARHHAEATSWTLVPGSELAVLVVDVVVEVVDGNDPGLVVRKGRVGSATATIDVLNDVPSTRAATAVLETNDPTHNMLVAPLDPAALGVGGLHVGPVDDRRLTLAFYYPWFGDRAPSDPRIAPDKPVAPYSTSDAASVAGMVDQARGAGIDGFLVSWSGPRHSGPVDLLFDAVEARPGFAVAPLLELRELTRSTLLGGSQLDVGAAASATRGFYAQAPAGSLLEVDGRRVLAAFGMWDLSPQEWAAFRSQIADLDLFVVGDRRDPSYAVDGIYDYDPNQLSRAGLEARSEDAIDAARLRPVVDPSAMPLLWAASVSPGFDNRASQPLWHQRTTWRDGGRRYDMTWEVALQARPDWVLITSWNEWYEQTHVVPGTNTGGTALAQTRVWADRFGASAPPQG
jgi:hypothetical protein